MLQLQWDPGHLLKNWADRQMVGIPTWGKVWNVLVWGGSVSLQLLGDVSRLVEN